MSKGMVFDGRSSRRPSTASTASTEVPGKTIQTPSKKTTVPHKWEEKDARLAEAQLKKLMQTPTSHGSAWRLTRHCLKIAPDTWALKIRGDILPSLEKALRSTTQQRPADHTAAVAAIDALAVFTATALETSQHQRPWELLPALAARIQRFGLGDVKTVGAVVQLVEASLNLPRPWDMTPWTLRIAEVFVEIVEAVPESERLENLKANLMRRPAVVETLVGRALEFPSKALHAWKVSNCPASVVTLDKKVIEQTLQGVRDSLPGPLWVFELCAVCVDASVVFNHGAVQALKLQLSSARPGREAAFRILAALAGYDLGLEEMLCPEVLRQLAAIHFLPPIPVPATVRNCV